MTYGALPYGSVPFGGIASFLTIETLPDRKIKLYYKNILEGSTVTVTTENTSYPKYRLYDRDIGLLFKGNSTPSQFQINIDQGVYAINPGVDKIIIPSGHNFSGKTVRLYHSLDGVTYEQLLAWVMPSDRYEKDLPYTEKRYWRFGIDNPSSAPELSELWLGKGYAFQINPIIGADERWRRNVFSEELESGVDTEVKRGERKRVRIFDLRDVRQDQKIDFEAWDALCEGIKPFWVQDHNGAMIYMKMINDLEFRYDGEDPDPYYSNHLELREVLGVTT